MRTLCIIFLLVVIAAMLWLADNPPEDPGPYKRNAHSSISEKDHT